MQAFDTRRSGTKQTIPKAIWEMHSAHQTMTEQVMADTETMRRFADVM